MHGTITDWQGELQVRPLVGAAIRLAVRHPIAALVVPITAIALAQHSELEAALLSVVPFGLLNRWTAALVHPAVLVALPLISLAWVRIARGSAARAQPLRQRLRGWLWGTVAAAGVGAGVLAASDVLGTQALVIVTLFAATVPALACDPKDGGGGWRLMSGHRWRWLGAWLLVHACLAGLFLLLFGLTVAFAPHDPTSLRLVRPSLPSLSVWPAVFDVRAPLGVLYEGLAIGLTLALSSATYAGLKQRRDVDDAQRWLEALA